MKYAKCLIAMVLVMLCGCVSVKHLAAGAQDNLSQIKNDANNAHQYLAAHVNENSDIKNADALAQKIPPLVTTISAQVTGIQTAYNKIYDSWYARIGRFIDTSFWTVVICGGICLIVIGCINFYTGGAITGAASVIGSAFKWLMELPTSLIHKAVTSIVGSKKTDTPSSVAPPAASSA